MNLNAFCVFIYMQQHYSEPTFRLNDFHFSVIETIDEEKKLNATYIISVARKLGCSIFLLPEDIMEVRMHQQHVDLFLFKCFHSDTKIYSSFNRILFILIIFFFLLNYNR